MNQIASISARTINKELANMAKVISLGLMFGTAMASPMLYTFPNIWLIDIAIFFPTSVVFLTHFRQELMMYGAITILLAILLGLAAYSAARTPLGELAPWLPVSFCLFVLLTVYALPEFHRMVRHVEAPDLEQGRSDIQLETVNLQYRDADVQPQEGYTLQRMLDFHRDTANIGQELIPGLADPQSSHASDIVLVDDQTRITLQRLNRVGFAGYLNSGFRSTTPSEVHVPRMSPTSGSSLHVSQVSEQPSRSGSPTSVDANVSSSASAEEQRPLLE